MCSIWLFLWCSLSFNTCEIGISSGCRQHFFSCLLWHKSSRTVSANAVKFKSGLQVQVWFWLGQEKKRMKKLPVEYKQPCCCFTFTPFQFLFGTYFFSNLGPEWACEQQEQEGGVTLLQPLDSSHRIYHLRPTTQWCTPAEQHPANRCQLSLIIRQLMTNLSSFFPSKKKKWSLSTVAFIMFRITTSRGWIPCLHLSLGRTDEKKEDVGWILLLHLIKFSAVWSLWWLDGLRRCWKMNRWDFLCDQDSQEAKSDINTSLCVASLFQGQLSCSF